MVGNGPLPGVLDPVAIQPVQPVAKAVFFRRGQTGRGELNV